MSCYRVCRCESSKECNDKARKAHKCYIALIGVESSEPRISHLCFGKHTLGGMTRMWNLGHNGQGREGRVPTVGEERLQQ